MNRGRTNTDHERHPGDEPRDAPSPTKFTPQRCVLVYAYGLGLGIYRESSEDTGSSSGTREGTEPSSRPVDNEGFHIARPVSDEEVERFLLLLQPKSSQQCGPNAQKTPDVQGSNDPKSVTTKGQESGKNVTCIATTSSADVRVRCKHDGKAIPFPLRPEAFHDLPLLRQALLDMTQHYNVIRRRTEQIEGTEQYRSTVNPGILLRMGNHAHYVVCRAR
ncbi:unnamed protein product [Aspergillus oryzae var. brunneus]|uniref:Unnamed protein product n=1 Tax=Aspergillus oryzae var. brunneus TaxID=332754 RepID=A0ABQ6L719_ASPOZ|nr:unnamed protein product [Aspergillus oryzae]GMG53829.1 unnamed protein product [Aspergillus oryzae var. brunneus]